MMADNCSFMCGCKKQYKKILCDFSPVFPNGNVLHNHSTKSHPGFRHWYSQDTAHVHHQKDPSVTLLESHPTFSFFTLLLSKPLICSPFLEFCILECSVDGIIQYVTFGDWLFHSAWFSGDSSKLLLVAEIMFIAEQCSTAWMYHNLFHQPPIRGHLVVYSFWILRIKLLWTFMHKFLCEHKISFLWLNAQECKCWVVWQLHV